MKIKVFNESDGENSYIILGEDGLPLYYENLFAILFYRNLGKSGNTIRKVIETLGILKKILLILNIDMVSTFRKGLSFDKSEIERVCYLASLKTYSIKENILDGESKNNVYSLRDYSLERSRMRVIERKEGFVSSNSLYYRLTVFYKYISWLESLFFEYGESNVGDYIKSKRVLKASSSNEDINEEHYRSLTSFQINRVYSVIHPRSKENPWLNNPALRARNFLIFKMLESIGCRPGELLKIRISSLEKYNDIKRSDLDGRYYITLRASVDKGDIRKNTPRGKTVSRKVPITSDLRNLVDDYIINHRRSVLSNSFEYLYLTRNNDPMSLSQLNKIFRQVSNVVDFKVIPYSFRHTWNDRFSEMADGWISRGKSSHEKCEADRRKLMGWSKNSKSAQHYSKRYENKRAMNIALKLQEKVMIDDSNLNMVFEEDPF